MNECVVYLAIAILCASTSICAIGWWFCYGLYREERDNWIDTVIIDRKTFVELKTVKMKSIPRVGEVIKIIDSTWLKVEYVMWNTAKNTVIIQVLEA